MYLAPICSHISSEYILHAQQCPFRLTSIQGKFTETIRGITLRTRSKTSQFQTCPVNHPDSSSPSSIESSAVIAGTPGSLRDKPHQSQYKMCLPCLTMRGALGDFLHLFHWATNTPESLGVLEQASGILTQRLALTADVTIL
jgi:hypothetical protein